MGRATGMLTSSGAASDDPASVWHYLNYVNTIISAAEMQAWVATGGSGTNADRRFRMRKATMWSCYSARISQAAYSTWHTAFGIFDGQMAHFTGKNAGLFFNDEIHAYPYGSYPFQTTLAEVAAEFDKIWVMGVYPWPGACDPNYSFQFALNVTSGMFPELNKAKPVIIGCPLLPYAGVTTTS